MTGLDSSFDGLVVAARISRRNGAWFISWEHGPAVDSGMTPGQLFDCASRRDVARRIAREGVEAMPGCWSRPFRWVEDPDGLSIYLLASEIEDEWDPEDP
jgi:hypothetical protein